MKTDVDEQSSAQPFWSGTLTFGLVSIPVDLIPANRSGQFAVRMLAPDGTPLHRRYYSPTTGRELPSRAMTRGFETEPNKFVAITNDELDKLAPEKSHDIDLRRFVNVDEISPIYFERGYFMAPTNGSSKPYQLLAAVMEKTHRAGIATFVMRGKEYLVAIVAENGILRAGTMRFQEEIRTPSDIGLPDKPEVSAKEVHRFERDIDKHAAQELPPEELHDETTAALMDVVKAKQHRSEDVIRTHDTAAGEARSAGLAETLTKSLAGYGSRRRRRRAQTAGHQTHRSRARLGRKAH